MATYPLVGNFSQIRFSLAQEASNPFSSQKVPTTDHFNGVVVRDWLSRFRSDGGHFTPTHAALFAEVSPIQKLHASNGKADKMLAEKRQHGTPLWKRPLESLRKIFEKRQLNRDYREIEGRMMSTIEIWWPLAKVAPRSMLKKCMSRDFRGITVEEVNETVENLAKAPDQDQALAALFVICRSHPNPAVREYALKFQPQHRLQ